MSSPSSVPCSFVPSPWGLLRLPSISPDPVAPALFPERLAADSKYRGRPRLAAAHCVQHVADVGLLDVLESGPPIPPRPQRRRLLENGSGQRGGRHLIPCRVEGGPLDDRAQLAHVARP